MTLSTTRKSPWLLSLPREARGVSCHQFLHGQCLQDLLFPNFRALAAFPGQLQGFFALSLPGPAEFWLCWDLQLTTGVMRELPGVCRSGVRSPGACSILEKGLRQLQDGKGPDLAIPSIPAVTAPGGPSTSVLCSEPSGTVIPASWVVAQGKSCVPPSQGPALRENAAAASSSPTPATERAHTAHGNTWPWNLWSLCGLKPFPCVPAASTPIPARPNRASPA